MTIKILTSFIATFTYIFVVYNLGIIKFKKKEFIKNLVIVYLSVGIGCLHFEMLVLPLFFIIMMILLFFQNKKIIQNFIALIFTTIIFLLSDIIQGSILMIVFNQNAYKLLANNTIVVLMHISLFCTAFIISSFISYILRKFRFDFKKINIKNKVSILIFSNIGLTALIFYINAMMIKYVRVDGLIAFVDSILFLSYLISTIVMTYIVVTNFKKEIEFKNKKVEFDNLKEYTSSLEIMYNDMRKFRHDYVNILLSMTGYIENKNLDGLEEFFNKRILNLSESILKKDYKLDKLQNIKITELKGLLSSKVIREQELGIDVFIDIMEPVEFINMDVIDLCKSIGILLDNSIEAALLCKIPSLKICIVRNESSVVIFIVNSCLEENPPIYKIFEKGFSTKGTNRGLGLSNLKEILSNYPHISLDTSILNKEFIQNLHILNS